MIGFCVAARQAATTRADISGSLPNCTPPSRTFGQEILISIASILESSKTRVVCAYSSTVPPDRLAMNRVSPKSSVGKIRSTTAWLPGFCRPIELSIPPAVSTTRCAALPSRGLSVVPFKHTAPTSRLLKPSTRVYSSPKPTQPDNRTNGVVNDKPQKSDCRRFAPSPLAASSRLCSALCFT